MIKLNFKNISVMLDFSFFAVLAIFSCYDKSGYGIMCLTACILHETGHLIAMAIKKNRVRTIRFYGGGIEIIQSENNYSLLVILGGVIANFIVAALCLFMNSIAMNIFGMINLLTGLFNLIPIGYLDGKKLIDIVLAKLMSPEKAICCSRAIQIVNSIVVITAIILLFFTDFVNISAIIVLVYIFAVDITANM